MSEPDPKHNNILEGGGADGVPFEYHGNNTVHQYHGGLYVKTNRVNEADLIVWVWKPDETTR